LWQTTGPALIIKRDGAPSGVRIKAGNVDPGKPATVPIFERLVVIEGRA